MSDQIISLKELMPLISDQVKSAVADAVKDSPELKKLEEDPGKVELKGDEKSIAFFKALLAGDTAEVRDMSEGTDSAGGYVVPNEFYGKVVEKRADLVSVRKYSTVIPMSTDVMDVPTEGTAMTFYWPAENATATGADVSFGNAQLTANMVVGLLKMSRQLMDDAKIDIVDYLARVIAKGLSKEEDGKFIAGSGSGEPDGFRGFSGVGTLAQAGVSLAYTDVTGLWYTIKQQYRANSVWFTSSAGAILLANLVDGNGKPIFTPNPDKKGLATMFGRPVIETDDIPSNLGAGTDETELWLNDMSYYMIGDRQTISTEMSTEAGDAFAKHQAWMKVYERIDGKVAQAEAFAYLSAVV